MIFMEGFMNFNQIERRLNTAIEILRIKDFYLLKNDASERSITHKLGEHLQYVIGNSLNVDCEYNRNTNNLSISKKIYVLESEIEKINRVRIRNFTEPGILGENYLELSVFPDIIVHKRGKNSSNTLAIEVKKSTSKIERSYDLKKLECYTQITSDANNLRYEYGAFIIFNTGKSKYEAPEIIWFKDGKRLE